MSSTAAKGYQAYRGRTVLTLRFRTESVLHVGSGFEDSFTSHDGHVSDVGLMALDAGDKPYVPPTTLKGAVRALAVASQVDSTSISRIFGDIRMSTDEGARKTVTGHPGWVVFSGATWVSAGDTEGRIDVLSPKSGGTGPVILSKRTAIDVGTGTADTNKLFQSLMVPPGTVFETRLTILRDPIDLNDPDIVVVLRALSSLFKHGLAIGRGKGDGHGLIKLSQFSAVERTFINAGKVQVQSMPTDPWVTALQKQDRLKGSRAEYVFKLSSDEPFVVVGPDLGRAAIDGEKGVNNKLRALRRNNTTPELPGTSLMGVLRARADWWSRLAVMRNVMDEDARVEAMRRLFGAKADDVRRQRSDSRTRSSKTGFAGILKLHSVKPTKTMAVHDMASVKVDRFSMGPFDSGLFSVEAFPKPSFDVALYLDDRASADDHLFMEGFVAWLQAGGPSGGLMLGHGSNRGFGWFNVLAEKV